jgi:hypothetical protein
VRETEKQDLSVYSYDKNSRTYPIARPNLSFRPYARCDASTVFAPVLARKPAASGWSDSDRERRREGCTPSTRVVPDQFKEDADP